MSPTSPRTTSRDRRPGTLRPGELDPNLDPRPMPSAPSTAAPLALEPEDSVVPELAPPPALAHDGVVTERVWSEAVLDALGRPAGIWVVSLADTVPPYPPEPAGLSEGASAAAWQWLRRDPDGRLVRVWPGQVGR